MTPRKSWSFSVGQHGRPHRVSVFENAQRDGVLALRWHLETSTGRKLRYESLGKKLRTADGKIIREVERWAKAKAQEKHEALMRGEADDIGTVDVAPVTIGEAKGRITDEKRGKYPRPSQHRRETERALEFACTVWGAQRAWNAIRKADIRELGRARIDQLRQQGNVGLTGAEHTVQRVLTVAQWLRDEELIEPGACVAAKAWKDELRSYWIESTESHELPAPRRPRYTIDEALRIVDVAGGVDARLELMLWLAPNQRMAQVARLHRSNVDLERNQVRIPTRGKKKGALISLTTSERSVLDRALTTGYLRELECAYLAGKITDYPIFPSGQLPGARLHRAGKKSQAKYASWRGPETPTATVERHAAATIINRRTITDWFDIAEARAKVDAVEFRGPYGVRRAFVDAAKQQKISREGLTALGGWADPQMADRVYAEDEQQYASEEARDVRARIRGEDVPESAENPANSQQTHNSAKVAQGAVE